MKASDILNLKDRAQKTVHVEQWGMDVTIQELGLTEGLAVMDNAASMEKEGKVTAAQIAQVVAWSIVDEDGNRVFSDDDVPELEKKNLKALMFLYQEIGALSSGDEAKN